MGRKVDGSEGKSDSTRFRRGIWGLSPCSAGAFAGSFVNRLQRRVAQRQKHLAGALGRRAAQFGKGTTKTVQPEISIAAGAIDPVEKCRDVDQFRAVFH